MPRLNSPDLYLTDGNLALLEYGPSAVSPAGTSHERYQEPGSLISKCSETTSGIMPRGWSEGSSDSQDGQALTSRLIAAMATAIMLNATVLLK